MAWEEDFPDWAREWFGRRRRYPLFGDFFGDFDRMMEEMFKEITSTAPKELVRERKLPDGSIVREMGPIVYGYSMTIGPDGKPVIREFGNVKPSMKATPLGVPRPGLELKEEREPLVDTMVEDSIVRIVAELPGVEKKDINLQSTEKTLTISVDTPDRKYHKELELPVEVDPDSSVASYKNGVLEVTLQRRKPRPRGREIKIE
jgi:HSP20 family protein